jgi:competence protein ComEC
MSPVRTFIIGVFSGFDGAPALCAIAAPRRTLPDWAGAERHFRPDRAAASNARIWTSRRRLLHARLHSRRAALRRTLMAIGQKVGAVGLWMALAGASPCGAVETPARPPVSSPPLDAVPLTDCDGCDGRRRMTIHFYDVGEGLSALVDLPDGRHIVVDTGDGARRAGCGASCEAADRHLVGQLRADLQNRAIDLLWITHQHADHIGGAPEILETFRTGVYVDNGRDPTKAEVHRARAAASDRGVPLVIVDPEHPQAPLRDSPDLKLTPIVPRLWPASCAHDPNECSIGLRIDFCASSVLFTGDAEHEEEAMLDPRGTVTLLQVAHHGSETSTSPGFLARVRPRYAVISAGKPGEGNNRTFCHPRARIVKRLTRVLGGSADSAIDAFDGDRCDRATPSDWTPVPASDVLWATERDGDVVLTTTGDGLFRRERP